MQLTVGDFIRKHRKQNGVTQVELAELIGINEQARISGIETDRLRLRFDEAVALSRELDFDLSELAGLVLNGKACSSCRGNPPLGYTCNACGRSG